jgi:hypothetical protein
MLNQERKLIFNLIKFISSSDNINIQRIIIILNKLYNI